MAGSAQMFDPRQGPEPRGSGLWRGFMRSAEQFSQRPAIMVDGKPVTYWRLREVALRIAASVQAHQDDRGAPLVAVFAHRSAAAFAAVLGSLLAGDGMCR